MLPRVKTELVALASPAVGHWGTPPPHSWGTPPELAHVQQFGTFYLHNNQWAVVVNTSTPHIYQCVPTQQRVDGHPSG